MQKSCRCRSYRDQFAASNMYSLRRVRPAFSIMRSAWKRLGVKSLFGKSQPGRTSQRGLTYTLMLRGIWAQCVVLPGIRIFEARSLIVMHPLGINNQVSCSLIHFAELVSSAQARGFFASSHSNVVSALEVREHLKLMCRMTLASVCLSCVGLREHPRLSWVRVITRAHLFL